NPGERGGNTTIASANLPGLQPLSALAYDSSNQNVYGVSTANNFLAAFRVGTPASLTVTDTVHDGDVQTTNFAEYSGAQRVATVVSPDGKHASSIDTRFRALSVADRDSTTGALGAYKQAIQLTGLSGDAHLAISGDGKDVYVTNPGDNSLRVYS